MQITVKGKQLDVGDSLRTHAETTVAELVGKYFASALEAHVILAKDAHLYRAEITVHPTKGTIIAASGHAHEPYPAFDEAARTMAKRLQRYRSKLQDRHGPSHEDVAAALNVKKVIFGGATTEEPAGDEPLIVAEMETPIRTLSVSEAVMTLELEDLPALMFTNAANKSINMIYRRADGNIGWVDPTAVITAAQQGSMTGTR